MCELWEMCDDYNLTTPTTPNNLTTPNKNMGEGDFQPTGGHRRKPLDPKKIQKIKEGGRKADEIRKKADVHHESHDVPAAEEELLKDLGKIPNGN